MHWSGTTYLQTWFECALAAFSSNERFCLILYSVKFDGQKAKILSIRQIFINIYDFEINMVLLYSTLDRRK